MYSRYAELRDLGALRARRTATIWNAWAPQGAPGVESGSMTERTVQPALEDRGQLEILALTAPRNEW